MSDILQQEPAAVAPEAPKGGNGFAVTSLITGILGCIPVVLIFGLIFGILGIFRAKKVNKGMVMSIIGIVLSVLWIIPFAVLTPHAIKALDPGCLKAISVHSDYPDSKVSTDSVKNPQAFGADLQAEIAGFTEAANKSKNATSKAAMQAEVADLTQILQAAASGQKPDPAVVAKSSTDEDALTKACGGF